MSYSVKINDTVASIENEVWKSSSPGMEAFLNNWLQIKKMIATTPEDELFWLNSPATPDPDYLIASVAVESLGGQLLSRQILEEESPIIENGVEIDLSTIKY